MYIEVTSGGYFVEMYLAISLLYYNAKKVNVTKSVKTQSDRRASEMFGLR